MADSPGDFILECEQFFIPYHTNAAHLFTRYDFRGEDRVGFFLEASWHLEGIHTINLPITIYPRQNNAGQIVMTSYFNDYYNRIYFLPSRLDFGSITQDTPLTLTVWNAFLTESLFQGLTLVNAQGVEVSGGVTAPYVFKPLESAVFTFTASPNGPPDLTGSAVWDFETAYGDGDNYTIELSGRRAKINPLYVNWSGPYSVEYQFKTDIFTTRNGREQRRALRQTPRKIFDYLSTPYRDLFRAFQDLLASWHNNVVIMPELPRQVVLVEPLAVEDLTAEIAANTADWLVPNMQVIVANGDLYESRTIESVAGTTLTFSGPGLGDWPTGSKIHPALSGRVSGSLNGAHLTSNVARVQVKFEVTPASEMVLPLPNPPLMFNGRELFVTKFNWLHDVDVTYESEREVVDYQFGRVLIATPFPFSSTVRKTTFLGRNYDETKLLLDFFCRCRGQRGEFYMPTWEEDIIVYQNVPSASADLRIRGTDFYTSYKDSTVYKAVMVRLKNGAVYYRRVQSVVLRDDDIGVDSVIVCDENFPASFTPADVLMVSWMPVWRHATDTLTIVWETNSVAQTEMTFKVLEDL